MNLISDNHLHNESSTGFAGAFHWLHSSDFTADLLGDLDRGESFTKWSGLRTNDTYVLVQHINSIAHCKWNNTCTIPVPVSMATNTITTHVFESSHNME